MVILELIHAFKEILSLLVGFSAFIRFKPMGSVSAFSIKLVELWIIC